MSVVEEAKAALDRADAEWREAAKAMHDAKQREEIAREAWLAANKIYTRAKIEEEMKK